MANNFSEYITKENERWDSIAYAAYGDVAEVNTLIEANPGIPITPMLAAGTRLRVPLKETVEPELDTSLLPPWKR